MGEKILRTFILDTRIRFKIQLIVVFVLAAVLENRLMTLQHNEFAKVHAKQSLVAQVPDLEVKLAGIKKRLEPPAPAAAVVKEEKHAVVAEQKDKLDGIVTLNGAPAAMINSEIYVVGDKVGNFVIREIALDSVRMEHAKARAEKIIKLYE